MENASRALLMAGSILIAIIIISIFVFSNTRITQLQQAKIEAEQVAEVAKFNEIFISYQKKAMYGTDIISVLNLGISNNNKYHALSGEEYYVNIAFKLKEETLDSIYKRKFNELTGEYDRTFLGDSNPGDTSYLEANKEYSLKENFAVINSFLQYANNSDVIIYDEKYNRNLLVEFKEKETGMAKFKRYAFKCTTVEYDENGRVNLMKFQQM